MECVMKINSINSSFGLVNFESKNKQSKSVHADTKPTINKKKLLYAVLGTLALAGTVAVIMNNARKGKIKQPEISVPHGDPKPVTKPEPKQQPLKPVDIKVINEKPEFSPEALDERIYGTNSDKDVWSFGDMKKYYEQLDKKGKKQVEKKLNDIRTKLNTKPEFSPEALERRSVNGAVKQDAWSMDEMKKYYGNDCATVRKSTSYVSYKYVSEDDKPLFEKRIYNALSDYGAGAVEIRTVNKNGTVISEIKSADGELIKTQTSNPSMNYSVSKFYNDGKLSKIVSDTSSGHTETLFNEGIKTSVHINKDGTKLFKIFQKDSKGKYNCIRREMLNEITGRGWSFGTDYKSKTVEYINNNKYSKTTSIYVDTKEYGSSAADETVKTVIRDRKGNIIDESKITKTRKPKGPDGASAGKLLEAWYKDYLELCKKYGLNPRACGVKGGAWDHYYELCLRRSDKDAYKSYLRLQEYRARYDEKAMLEQILRMGDEKFLLLSPEKLAKLDKKELEALLSYIKKGYIKVDNLQNLSSNKIKELIVKAQEQERIAQEARIAERRLEEQRQLEFEQNENYNHSQEPEIIVYA